MRIVIHGHAHCGKAHVSRLIRDALRTAGMVVVEMPSPDGKPDQPVTQATFDAVQGKEATISLVQEFRSDFFPAPSYPRRTA